MYTILLFLSLFHSLAKGIWHAIWKFTAGSNGNSCNHNVEQSHWICSGLENKDERALSINAHTSVPWNSPPHPKRVWSERWFRLLNQTGCSHPYIFCYQIKKSWVFSKLHCTFMYIWHETLNMLQAINSLKNVDSTALLQFLHPILNMLLHLVGNGGETLQVSTKIFHFLSVYA